MGKACHVKSETPIRYTGGTVTQVVRKMNLELRWDVRFANKYTRDISHRWC